MIVYNFLDISHACAETDIIRELTEDEAAFRSLTRSWFEHSGPLHHPEAAVGAGPHGGHHLGPRHHPRGQPREGDGRPRDLGQPALQDGAQPAYNSARGVRGASARGHAAAAHKPDVELHLRLQLRDFLVYNNDANRHIRYYRNTFQHGGISMEEMIVPYIVLKPKL